MPYHVFHSIRRLITFTQDTKSSTENNTSRDELVQYKILTKIYSKENCSKRQITIGDGGCPAIAAGASAGAL
jgi:uncharacterized FAD-dependent dehydrogenase